MIEVQTMETSHHASPSPSPSFSSYSSETLAEIAARVIKELRRDPCSVSDDETLFEPSWENDNDNSFTAAQPDDHHQNDDPVENDNDDDDFEFAFVSRDPNTSPVSADDIFYNGQIRPLYPIFDSNLLFTENAPRNDAVASVSPTPNTNHEAGVTRRRRLPLRKLMFEERETASCSSSASEADESIELEGVAEGTYCVWSPNSVGIRNRKKRNSTGSASKRWRLRDLLLRSHSEGKEQRPLVFRIPSKRASNKVVAHDVAKPISGDNHGGVSVAEHDVKNRDQTKRKSYRQEFVGLFTNVNGLGRNLHPF